MSYVAFDLDALNKAPHVARAIGCAEDTILGGLVRLWAHCFREAREVVAEIEVRGLFGVDAKDALVAFGFLETMENGFRVKGADRYLRVTEGRKKGGQNSKHNLIPGAKQKQIANELRGENQARVSREPGKDKGEKQAMESLASVSPFHRTPIEIPKGISFSGAAGERKKKAQKKKAKVQEVAQEHFVGISWADAVRTLFELFEKLRGAKYAPTGRDFAALEALAKRTHGDFAEVSRRWANALRSGFPVVGELWQLEAKFNQFAGTPEHQKAPAPDPNQGIIRRPVEIKVCAICGTSSEFKSWDQNLCAAHHAHWQNSGVFGIEQMASWVEAERLLP